MHSIHPSVSSVRSRSALVSLVVGVATSIIPSAQAFDSGATLYWNGGGGTWDTTNAEWTTSPTLSGGFGVWDNTLAFNARLNGAGGEVSLVNPITVGSLVFETDGYILNGSALNFRYNVGSIGVASGHSQTIASALGGLAIEKSGAGTLILSGANTYTGATDVKAGTLVLSGGTIGNSTSDTGQQIRLYDASFRVESGGNATAYSLGIFKGDATISGAGSTLTTSTVTLGNAVNAATFNGAGSLVIADGATVTTTGNADIGNSGIATVTVGGSGTTWNVRNLRLGIIAGGDGAITQTGGLVNVTNKLYFGPSGAGKGVYRLEGGTLAIGTSSGIQTATTDYLFELAGGTLKVTGSNLTSSVNVSLRSDTMSTIDTNSLNGTFSGSISGSGSLEKNGEGNLILSGANTFTGDLRVNSGVVRATTRSTALGAGALTLSGGALQLANDTGLAFGRDTTVSAATTITSDRLTSGSGVTHTLGTLSIGAQTLSIARGANVSTGTAGIAFGDVTATGTTGTTTFSVASGTRLSLGKITGNNRNLAFTSIGDTEVSGAIATGAGTLIKSGAGTLTLTGANTYTGATTVSGGSLVVNGSLANSAVTVANGATLGGTGTFAGLTTIQSGARLSAGVTTGTIAFTNGLTLNTGAILDFQLGSTNDLILVSGGTLTGSSGTGGVTINLAHAGGFVDGTYTLVDFTNVNTFSSFDLTDFTLGNKIAGYVYTLGLANSALVLTATAIPEPSTFAIIGGVLSLGLAVIRRRARRAVA